VEASTIKLLFSQTYFVGRGGAINWAIRKKEKNGFQGEGIIEH